MNVESSTWCPDNEHSIHAKWTGIMTEKGPMIVLWRWQVVQYENVDQDDWSCCIFQTYVNTSHVKMQCQIFLLISIRHEQIVPRWIHIWIGFTDVFRPKCSKMRSLTFCIRPHTILTIEYAEYICGLVWYSCIRFLQCIGWHVID